MNIRGRGPHLSKEPLPKSSSPIPHDFEETRKKILDAYTLEDLEIEETRHFVQGRLIMTDNLIIEQHAML